MLITSLLVLTAVTANGLQDNDHSPRRTKQLDLQDIQAPVKEEPTVVLVSLEKNPAVVNGYLPPASPSSPQPSIVGAQSIQTLQFEPLNSLDKDEPCSPASERGSCSPKNVSSSESKIPKPSRDLVPPFNDLEQESATFSNVPREEEEIKDVTKFPSTTEKLVTASSVQVTTRVTPKPLTSATTANARVFASKAEATNELRSYLPPQGKFSAAAQTNVAVVQPLRPNTDHDHHHDHHHGKNFDICADAFHSFLCAPLKARKRITGAFPNSLRGQSSFINYQKLLPNYEPAPSNALQNAYLPPKRVSSSPNFIQSTPATTRPIVTPTLPSRPPQKVVPEPSNSNGRFYLPPIKDNKILPAPSRESAFKFLQPKPTPSSRPASVTSPRTTTAAAFTKPPFTRAPAILTAGSSQSPEFNTSPSNENRFYLPPKINSQSAPSFVTSSAVIHSVSPTFSPQTSASASFSATSTTGKPQPVVNAAVKPSTAAAKPQPSTPFLTSSLPSQAPTRVPPSFNSVSLTQKPFPSSKKAYDFFKFAGQSSGEDRSYLPPDVNLPAAAKPQPSTFSPLVTPSSPTRAPSSFNSVSPTQKPFPSTKNSFKFSGQSSSEDRSYLPPDVNLAEAAQTNSAALAPKNPFHHGRDLCTDPFHSFLCVSAKPRKRITGQLPSGIAGDSSNTQESRLRPDESKLPLESASAQDVGYKYPRPSQPPTLPNLTPSSTAASYSYPKQQDTTPTASATTKQEPRPSEARVVSGYQYPKPDETLPLRGEQSKAPSTTSAPTTGYSYPKPQKPLPLPTEQKEVLERLPPPKADAASPTTQTRGYQYPRPDQGLKLPEKSGGYSYPKPGKRLELPTESRAKQSSPSLDSLGALGSAEFIPVNKLDFKRSESKLVAGLRRFGERQKKRQRETYSGRKRGE